MGSQRDYLVCLYSAQRLLASGCEGIYHMQIAAYYIALQRVEASKVKDVKPGMSAAHYRKLWKGDSGREADKCWWLQLVDIAADEMLRPLAPDTEMVSGEAWSDERLAEHFAGIVAQQQQEEAIAVAAPAPHAAPRPAAQRRRRGGGLGNPNTVWFGSTPIALREDLAVPTYYTYCKFHSVHGIHCRKDMQTNRPDKDTVVRKLRLGELGSDSLCLSD